MVSFIIIAALGILVVIVILAPHIKKWFREKHNVGGEEVSQFNCTLAAKGNDATSFSANDTYDCVEVGKEDDRSEQLAQI